MVASFELLATTLSCRSAVRITNRLPDVLPGVRPDIVTAARELLVSGDALGWTSLILLRYIGYCEGSCSLLVQQGVLAATVGTMRSWAVQTLKARI